MPVTLKGIYRKFIKYPIINPIKMKQQRKRLRKIYSLFIQNETLCFDIGTHKGKMSDLFLELGANVIGVEPHPDLFLNLQEKYKNNDKIKLLNMGASDEENTLLFYPCEDKPSRSTFSLEFTKEFTDCVWSKPIKIPTITLDKLIEMYGLPAFCKIDVENLEKKVLDGLNQKIKYLSFEFHFRIPGKVHDCIESLERLGSPKFNYYIDDTNKFIFKNWVDKNELLKSIQKNKNKRNIKRGDIYVFLGDE
ncbi:MAG TPA: FkbM family methyltransferase [Candidatus Bathyarchaeia archaeon]|nr:FkbM family methyltransferase [Candidatus Bathyarchaeia archaeon]